MRISSRKRINFEVEYVQLSSMEGLNTNELVVIQTTKKLLIGASESIVVNKVELR